MKCSDAIDRVVENLLTRGPEAPDLPAEVLEHIAGCRACIEELATVSSALTGLPSALKEKAASLLTCQECQDALGAYVEDELVGQDVAELHPKVARHLGNCSACREQHDTLLELMRQDAAGAFGEAPHSVTFGEWLQRRMKLSLWQPFADAWRLITEIPVLVSTTAASFGQLLPPLAPRRVPIGAYRERGEEGASAEVLELPCRELSLMIEVRFGPASAGKCTLILQVNALSPSVPIQQVRVALLQGADRWLESTSTDEDGLAVLQDLEVGRYTIRVEHAGKKVEFPVALNSGDR